MVVDHDTIPVVEDHPSGLCCICDNAVMEYDEIGVCVTNGCQYLAHADCIQGVWAEDEEPEE